MSEQEFDTAQDLNNQGGRGKDDEKLVIDFLKNNGDFLCGHPDLVECLTVPHNCGGAVSLIEHQVTVLKDKNRAYRQKLKELLEIARENDQLNEKLHELTLELIGTQDIDDILLAVQESLRNDFGADIISIKLLAEKDNEDKHPEFIPSDTPGLEAFDALFVGQRPLCGRLKKEQLTFLFKDNAARIGSAAIIPLEETRRYGLLAIGSFDSHKFLPTMGTIFLRHMSSIVSRALKPHMD